MSTRLKIIFATIMLSLTHVTTQACNVGWFGTNCQYKCHCSNNQQCDDSGRCTSGCDPKWFGPSCQFENIADINTISSPFKNNDNCVKRGLPVEIKWNREYILTWMRLVFSHKAETNISVTANSSKGESIKCINHTITVINETTLDFHCNHLIYMKEVKIEMSSNSSLCSLFISGGRNVAIKQLAKQTGTYTDLNYQYKDTHAENAVDGNTSGDFKNVKSCTHTDTTDIPKWNLTLSKTFPVYKYVIYNRKDNADRLRNFTLKSSNSKGEVFSYQDPNTIQPVYTVLHNNTNRDINSVEISIVNSSKILTLCEVEIYGDSICEHGKFGRDCEYSCNCDVTSETCLVSTGGCPSGCRAGFYGEGCIATCPSGKYGKDCANYCDLRCYGTQCDHVTGVCTNGCEAGYMPPNCQEECKAGFYGMNCSSTCSSHCNTTCKATDGTCQCKPGYEGATCTNACRETFYGVDCKASCSMNCLNQSCDNVDGRCKECIPGKTGDFCEKDCEPGLYGPKCASKCESTCKGANNDCRPENGTCLLGCDDGYRGELCRDVTKGKDISTDNQIDIDQMKIPINCNASMSVGLNTENKAKNRYKNISAYDHSRVHLMSCPEKKQGDYINASFVKSYKNNEIFIASQGPNKIILEDFLRMIWEQKSEKVVMLTNLIEEGKQKCEQYWPDENAAKFGEIEVRLINKQVFADYTVRKLELWMVGEASHPLTHFHFTSWPDKTVPSTPWSLVDFHQRVFSTPASKAIVVHCSAGVGRTGTFIGLHNVIKQAEATQTVDFYTTLKSLREDRVYMIQTAEQYIFLHHAAQVGILCVGTTIQRHDISEKILELEMKNTDKYNFEKEFKAVCEVCSDKDEGRDDEGSAGSLYQNSRTIGNKVKNRFSNILPKEQHRPFLYCDSKDMGDYINAVAIPSFTKQKQQFLTQIPLPTTVVDFWRLVTHFKVSLIVAFEVDPKDKDSTIGEYLPTTKGVPVNCGNTEVETCSVTEGQCWEEQTLSVTLHKKRKTRPSIPSSSTPETVTHLKYTATDYKPQNILPFVLHARSKKTQDGKVVYTCRNGADHSGLACVLSLLIDRMDHDNLLTVPIVVGTIKSIRPQVIPTLEQYKSLYYSLKMYVETDSVYSNFETRNNGLVNAAFEDNKDDINVYANS
ncbi:uncharacterized protein LOC131950689 [Physella acuta]|uniref:uncharacterized protein LOC131950689 n=1 Tax=Physella acuta TaxID=109671 RepID=UPI0027DDA372|nr:uncharacterized protein LOC131950689 [Physella acuta]